MRLTSYFKEFWDLVCKTNQKKCQKNVCFTTYTYFICWIDSVLTVHRLLDVVGTELSLGLCAGDCSVGVFSFRIEMGTFT